MVLPVFAGYLASCGGKVADDSNDAGPVHMGTDLYSLTITAVSDSCIPPMIVGDMGNLVVVAKAAGGVSGFNIPVCYSQPNGLSYQCQRDDISSGTPLTWNFPVQMTSCTFLESVQGRVVTFSGDEIDVEWQATYSGLGSCPSTAPYPSSDCSSDRIFQFHWVKSCTVDASSDSIFLTDC